MKFVEVWAKQPKGEWGVSIIENNGTASSNNTDFRYAKTALAGYDKLNVYLGTWFCANTLLPQLRIGPRRMKSDFRDNTGILLGRFSNAKAWEVLAAHQRLIESKS